MTSCRKGRRVCDDCDDSRELAQGIENEKERWMKDLNGSVGI
jgi:hypothetical protein